MDAPIYMEMIEISDPKRPAINFALSVGKVTSVKKGFIANIPSIKETTTVIIKTIISTGFHFMYI